MRDSILRIVDDLETRIEQLEETNSTGDDYTDGANRGKRIAYSYVIDLLKMVVDDHPNIKG